MAVYGKPPKQHQFPKGKSGNPRGRPKGSKNRKSLVPPVWEDHLVNLVLKEAYRQVPTIEQGMEIPMSTIQAVLRRNNIEAMKGKLGNIRLTLQLLQLAEEKGSASHNELLKTAIDYKIHCEEHIEDCRRTGGEPPEFIPKPDDIEINLATGEVSVTGPLFESDKRRDELIRKGIHARFKNIELYEEILTKHPDDERAKAEMDREYEILERLKTWAADLYDQVAIEYR